MSVVEKLDAMNALGIWQNDSRNFFLFKAESAINEQYIWRQKLDSVVLNPLWTTISIGEGGMKVER
jgi:hypothetical protein